MLARAALGERAGRRRSTALAAARPGPLVNATIWTILALRQAGRPAPPRPRPGAPRRPAPVRRLELAAKAALPDSNDTAAAIQALRAAGVSGAAGRRAALAYLRARQNADGGFGLAAGRALGRTVDGLGDPGAASPAGRKPGRGRLALPLAHAPRRRQLPLQRRATRRRRSG